MVGKLQELNKQIIAQLNRQLTRTGNYGRRTDRYKKSKTSRRAKAYNGGEGYAGTQKDSSGIETSRMLPYSGVMHQKTIRYMRCFKAPNKITENTERLL